MSKTTKFIEENRKTLMMKFSFVYAMAWSTLPMRGNRGNSRKPGEIVPGPRTQSPFSAGPKMPLDALFCFSPKLSIGKVVFDGVF